MHKKGISLVAGSAVGVLAVGVTLCAGGASAVEQTSSATATVNVAVGACTFERTSGSGTYTGTLANGAAPIPVPGSTFKTLCNDGGGYAVYAVGYSNDELGNTDLISNLGASDNIHTGVYVDSSSPSSWAMKLENNNSDYAPAVINNTTGSDFTTFHAIPNNYTMVASYNGSTLDPSSGSNTGSTYTMVHPGTMPTPIKLIDDLEYMQDFATLTNTEKTSVLNSMEAETTYTLKDKRDEQEYTMAKLKDGKVWMTKNLNLAGGTALSADDTDVDSSYISSFTTSNNLTKTNDTLVLPASAVKNSDNNNLTDRSQFSTNNYAYVYNSSNTTGCGDSGQEKPCYSYYSWDVATLGSGRSISTDNTDAFYSICPKGWKLPTSRTTAATNWQTESDFYVLAHQYGLDSTTSTSESDNGFYTQAGPGTAPNFLLAGYYNIGSFYNGGSSGYYWSSTSGSTSDGARRLRFYSSNVNSAGDYSRRLGFSVRCLLRQ